MFLLTSPLIVYGVGVGAFNYRFSRLFLILTVSSIIIEQLAKMRNLLFRLSSFEYLVSIYCLLALISVLYVSDYDAFIKKFFGLIECILILYVIRIFTRKGYWLRSVQIYLLSSITVLLASSYQIVNVLRGNLEGGILPFPSLQLLERYEELENWQYFGGITDGAIRVSATFVEPNILAGYCASLIPFAIVMILISSKKRIIQWRSLLNIFILLGLVVIGISTVSKAGFLSMALGILLTFGFTFRKFSSKQKYWSFFSMTLIVVFCVLYISEYKNLFLNRLSLGDSGHIDYTINAWNEYISGSWTFGHGFGQFGSAHTVVLTALIDLGLLGAFLVIAITTQPLSYVKYLIRLSSKVKYDPQANNYFFLLSASLASFCGILLGLYLYDYWIHQFTWISIAFLMSLVSNLRRDFKRREFATV